MAPVLITGVAGFIGHHTAIRYLRQGVSVVGVDIADFGGESPVRPLAAIQQSSALASSLHRLRSARFAHVQAELQKARASGADVNFEFVHADVSDNDAVLPIFERHKPSLVVHLAARAGVRASIEEPHAFARCNLVGFVNMLDACVKHGVDHFVYASSSSVYGNRAGPCAESMPVNLPVSPYAATKAANELLAHSYAACHKLNTTGLRFFTVYGPYGRPDMALWIFADAILSGRPIPLFNNGEMVRDFTYVDDVVDAVVAAGNALRPNERGLYRILNVGGGTPVPVRRFVDALQSALKVTATIKQLPMQVRCHFSICCIGLVDVTSQKRLRLCVPGQ